MTNMACAKSLFCCHWLYLIPAEEEQQAPNPLSALFANMKVSNMGTPTAQTPSPHLKAPTGTAPAANSPALLTPSFFRQHSLPQVNLQVNLSKPQVKHCNLQVIPSNP